MRFVQFVILVGAALTATACSGAESSSSSNSIAGWNGPAARDACHDKIEDRLKSPGSAEFEGLFEAELIQGSDAWKVSGHVDSENGFGGTVRSEYTCTVTPQDEERAMVSVGSLVQR